MYNECVMYYAPFGKSNPISGQRRCTREYGLILCKIYSTSRNANGARRADLLDWEMPDTNRSPGALPIMARPRTKCNAHAVLFEKEGRNIKGTVVIPESP